MFCRNIKRRQMSAYLFARAVFVLSRSPRGGVQAKMKWAKAREKDLLRDILIFEKSWKNASPHLRQKV